MKKVVAHYNSKQAAKNAVSAARRFFNRSGSDTSHSEGNSVYMTYLPGQKSEVRHFLETQEGFLHSGCHL